MITGRSQWKRPKGDALEDAKKSKKVYCLHILVKHEGSRRPGSWRSDKITRSKEDARKVLHGERCSLSDFGGGLFFEQEPRPGVSLAEYGCAL